MIRELNSVFGYKFTEYEQEFAMTVLAGLDI